MAFVLRSAAFSDGGQIPPEHTCEGDDLSPALSWDDPPAGTRSFVLIVDDPDAPDPAAPKMVWDHWILFNLPSDCRDLAPGVSTDQLPPGTGEGVNSWGQTGYGGPCPPIGRHRYFHRLYALDTCLPQELENPAKNHLLLAMEDHILGHATLIGTYQSQEPRG